MIYYAFTLLFFLSGLSLYVFPYFGVHFNLIPGDLADARLNNYFLEHGYLWLTGTADSFWNAPFFYPIKNAMTYSDNLLGSLPFYAIWRFMKFDRETSFQLWIVLGLFLNYFSMTWVLKKLGSGTTGICVGAFIFTFSPVMLTQLPHAQLLYRFSLPICFYFFNLFFKDFKPKHLFISLFFVSWQFYCSIYIGYFTVLFLLAFILARFVLDGNKTASRFMETGLSVHSRNIIIFILFCTSLAVLFYPYILTAKNGVSNPAESIFSMLPRPSSYLLSTSAHPLLGSNYHKSGLPMKHEHIMYLGLLPWLSFFFYLLASKAEPNRKKLALTLVLSICLLIALTLSINGHSLYSFMIMLPGINAVRAVSRIILVLLLPFSILSAFFVSFLMNKSASNKILRVCVLTLILLVFIENRIHPYTFPKKLAQTRISSLKKILPDDLNKNTVLVYLNPYAGQNGYSLIELDAMFAAQELGIKTLNGYSGQRPKGHQFLMGTGAIHASLYGMIKNNDHTAFENPLDCIIVLKQQFNRKCIRKNLKIDMASILDKPLPDKAFSGKITPLNNRITRWSKVPFLLSVTVTNTSPYTWPSTGDRAVKLSYRWGDQLSGKSTEGFDPRIRLPHDLKPGESAEIIFNVLPKKRAGSYFIEFDLLQESVSWFAVKGNKTTTINVSLK